MEKLRKEFEELLGYKPHRKMGEAKLKEKIEEFKERNSIPDPLPKDVVEVVEAPEIDPIEDIAEKTPEQIEDEIIAEAAKTVPEFIPEPEKIDVTEEDAKKIQETVSDNPLLTAMNLLLTSQSKTNDLLEKLGEQLSKSAPIGADTVTPPEAIANLTKAQIEAPLGSTKRYRVLILKVDLSATDGGQERSETGHIFETEEDAIEFGKKYAPGLTPEGAARYRIYPESIIIPSHKS